MNASNILSDTISNGVKLEIYQGDLTREEVDAIVNAANARLVHGGGVADAIVRAGGITIQEESDAWVRLRGPVQHAKPAVTGAGALPSKFVIHAVGPIWGEGDEDEKLAQAIEGSLTLADEMDLRSISFPAISTGIFGFPQERAAPIFFNTIQGYLEKNSSTGIRLVRIVLFDKSCLDIFLQSYRQWKAGREGAG